MNQLNIKETVKRLLHEGLKFILKFLPICSIFFIIGVIAGLILKEYKWLDQHHGLVEAIATIILVAVTIFYALEAREHRKIIEKEAQRLKIGELCRDFFLMDQQLSSEIINLQQKKYDWNGRESKWRELKNFKKFKDLLLPFKFIEISKKFPEIKEKINSHDKKVSEIEKKLKRIDEIIKKKGFEEKCKKLINEFNEKHQDEIEKSPGLKCSDSDIPFFLKHMINKDEEIENYFSYYQFWKENRAELLKIREDKEVREEIKQLYEISDQLKKISIELRNRIQEEILAYREKFYIPDKEITKP